MRSFVRCRPQWNRGLTDVRDEMERLFNDMAFNDGQNGEFWAPTVDIVEETDKLVVTAELPGVDKKDVKISLQDNVFTIEGEKTRTTEEKQDKFYRTERNYGKFSRSFNLPTKVATDKIEAEFNDGILTINLPKVEEAKPHQITIK
jgi:HSP20 family protein